VYPQDRPWSDDCLHAATVRAGFARATIEGIDVAPARGLPGVVRVLTAADVRGTNRYGLLEPDQSVLAEDRVRGASDVLALVLATTEAAAREGARRVGVRLTPQAPLVDPERACDADAPAVHPERPAVAAHPNVVAEHAFRRGHVARALARSAAVVEGVYRTSWVEHAFLAPEAGIAERDADGRLVLFVATQWPEQDLRQAAAALGEPVERLRLVQQAIGGAFGGREDVSLHILLLLAAQQTGHPVRMVWDRAESIRGHGKRHPFRIRHMLGANGRGRLTAARIDILADAGCYASTSAAVIANAIAQACGPYALAAVEVTGRAVYTNNPFTCAFRGFGVNQVTFAMEQQVNKLAARLGLDPAVVRRRSFVGDGGRLATGASVGVTRGLTQTLEAAGRRASRRRVPRMDGDWRSGRGLACALKNVGFGFGFDEASTAEVTVARGGAVVRIGAAEVGQGVETVLTQIAAETLAIHPRRVAIVWADTTAAPEAGSASASHQTFVAGNAVRGACERVRLRLATACGPVTVRFTYTAPPTRPLGKGRGSRQLFAFAWSTCVADVAVDIATGRVRVLRVVDAIDAGRVVNPALFAAQVEGGVVMGQGYALQERFVVHDGMPCTMGLDACGIPTAMDAVPQIETVAVEAPEPAGPFGARGIGEITMIPVVPAITAAIHAAVGVWIDALPASPERVLAALAAR
jgi:CO/xanthine dehydrogenase Mo-binding subunit